MHARSTNDTRGLPLLRHAFRKLASEDYRFRLYYRVLSNRVVGDLYIQSRGPLRDSRVTSKTELVIDGFPRSANSLARVMMEQLQGRHLRISSHLHTPRAIIKAVELGVPSLLLVRDPDDAVASLVQLQPGLSPKCAFEVYSDYYDRVRTVADDVVIGHFKTVVDDFEAVVGQLNEKFGTHFLTKRDNVGVNSPETTRLIDHRVNLYEAEGDVEVFAARPSGERLQAWEILRDLPSNARRAQAAARQIYGEFQNC